jgi:anti-sigma B factor antagonist
MSISAEVYTDAKGNITVHVTGGLDYENGLPLRTELLSLNQKNPWAVITLDLGKLDFVGSSGIGHFVETIKILNHKNNLKLANVKSEFLKVFKLYNLNVMEFLEEVIESEETEEISQRFANRRTTFQN